MDYSQSPSLSFPEHSRINWKHIPLKIACEVDQYLSVKEVFYLSTASPDFRRDSQVCTKYLKPDESEADHIYYIPLSIVSEYENLEKTINVFLDVEKPEDVKVLSGLPRLKSSAYALFRHTAYDEVLISQLITEILKRDFGIYYIGIFSGNGSDVLIDACILDCDSQRCFVLKADKNVDLVNTLKLQGFHIWILEPQIPKCSQVICPNKNLKVLTCDTKKFLQTASFGPMTSDIHSLKTVEASVSSPELLSGLVDIYLSMNDDPSLQLYHIIDDWYHMTGGQDMASLVNSLTLKPSNFGIHDLLGFTWFPPFETIASQLEQETQMVWHFCQQLTK